MLGRFLVVGDGQVTLTASFPSPIRRRSHQELATYSSAVKLVKGFGLPFTLSCAKRNEDQSEQEDTTQAQTIN